MGVTQSRDGGMYGNYKENNLNQTCAALCQGEQSTPSTYQFRAWDGLARSLVRVTKPTPVTVYPGDIFVA